MLSDKAIENEVQVFRMREVYVLIARFLGAYFRGLVSRRDKG